MDNKQNFLTNFGNRIKNKRLQLGISQDELATRIGYTSRSTISKIESGKTDIARDKIIEIAKALHVTPAYLMGWEDESINNTKIFTPIKKGIKIPILGKVAAGIPIKANTDIEDYVEISEDMAEKGEYYGLKIKGNSMLPEIKNGDTVIFRVQPDVENGQIAIVMVNGDDATCKKVSKSKDGITLIGFNHEVYEPKFYSNKDIQNFPVTIAGLVVEVRRNLV